MAVRDTPVRLDGAEIIAQDLAKIVSAQALGNQSIKLTTSTEGNSSASAHLISLYSILPKAGDEEKKQR